MRQSDPLRMLGSVLLYLAALALLALAVYAHESKKMGGARNSPARFSPL